MRNSLSAQQTAFYSKNGYIEFEIPQKLPPCDIGRDQWRTHPKVQEFLVRKLGPIVLDLTSNNRLLLACDQWITKENRPEKPCLLKDMFSIQGLEIGVAMAVNQTMPEKKSSLGILPLPSPGQILFFRPSLILDWPHLASDIYLAVFGLPTAVYAHNPRDPATNFLKQFGYNFGDVLKNDTHPIVLRNN
jgi:hypothetical protein